MASYPTAGSGFFQRAPSAEDWVDDSSVDRAVNGVAKVRGFYTAKKRAWTIFHLMNNADRLTFETFYDTNRRLSMTFLWMGNNTNYTVLFARAPKLSYRGALAVVEVHLIEQ